MSFTDTQSAKKYASIAEVAAAQAKVYADKLEGAPDYAAQAEAAAAQASDSAQSALTAQNGANAAAGQASASANEAVQAAADAEGAAEAVFGSSLHAPTGEVLSTLPSAAGRVNTVPVFDGAGDATVKDIADFAILDSNGKIPVSMIPAVALSEVFVVSSQAAMLALDAQEGDVAKRTDLGYSFILASEPASTLSNWVQISDDVLAQLGLSTGATEVGAVDDDGNSTTVQGALALKASKAFLSASSGSTRIGAGSTTVDNLLVKFSPLRYGAKADGTNDTAAFTTCMAAMPSGATMDLQGLTYSVTDIEVTKPMRIINGTINVLYGSLKGGIYVHDTNNVHVHNVTTIVDYANKASYSASNVSGIHFENCTEISAVNCTAIGSKNDSYLATGSWGCPIHAYQCDGVTFYNCEVSHSDKEGCMTRFCNDVIMNTIIAKDCNYSGVGTSGGDRVMATNIYSYRSGLSNLSFNSNNFSLCNLYSEGNKQYNGLALGHSHEAEQYSFSGTLTGITVIDSAETGIYVSKCNNISISGAVIQGCGIVSPGNGINIIGSTNDFANVNLSGININTVNGNGIQVQTPNNVNINISASTFRACSASALKINANGYTLINGVMFRGNGNDVYATPYDTQTSTQARAESLAIKSCDFENTSGLNVSFYGHKRFTMDSCTMYNFSSNATTVTGSILCTGSLSGVAYPTPDIFTINNTAFLGSTASGAAIPVVISPDGVSTGKVMSIKGCHFANPTTSPISAPSASYSIVYNSNTRGSDSNTTTVSVPASGTLSVSNGNQTTFNFPSIIRRDSGGNVSITSYGNGSLVLTNYSPSPTGITLQW